MKSEGKECNWKRWEEVDVSGRNCPGWLLLHKDPVEGLEVIKVSENRGVS